jgi:heptosyltransferase-2
MALPAIRAVSEIHGGAGVTLLARDGLENLFNRYAFVREVVSFSKKTEAEAHASLADRGFKTIILLTNSFRSAWNAKKTGIEDRIGFAGNFRSLLLSRTAEPDTSLHMTDRYLSLLEILGGSGFPRGMDFPLLQKELKFAISIGSLNGAVGIPLGARYGEAKCWPFEKLKNFILMVLEKSRRNVVLFGTEKEEEQAAELAGLVPVAAFVSQESRRIINLAGKTSIGEMAAAMDRCEWIVANDSGPLHVAGALGKKTIGLFGSTDPGMTSPLSDKVIVIDKGADCAPCFKRKCDRDFKCMLDITPGEVFNIVENR